jgi:hypothetical protein
MAATSSVDTGEGGDHRKSRSVALWRPLRRRHHLRRRSDSFLHLEHRERVPDMVATTSWLRYDALTGRSVRRPMLRQA